MSKLIRSPVQVRCRVIEDDDLDSLADLLREGFPERALSYWRDALAKLSARDAPDGYPRHGYVLEAEGELVGVILLIFSSSLIAEAGVAASPSIRCNVSSWFVRPAFRSQGALLISRALRFKEVTYVNISPAPHTWPILEAQGYRRYSDGLFVCAPALIPRSSRARVRRQKLPPARTLTSARALGGPALGLTIEEPVRSDCILVSVEAEGGPTPFVFVPTKIKALRRGVLQLAYCRDTAEFVRHAGPIGRKLLRSGYGLVTLDAEGPIPGLVGRYFPDRTPKYYKGPRPPALNDLRCTEALLFGR